MHLEYDFTEQDYIDYNIYHTTFSNSMKRSLLTQRYGLAILFITLGAITYWCDQNPSIFTLIYFTFAAIIWIIVFPKIYNRILKKKIMKLVVEGKRNYLFGHHELRIDQDGIHVKTEASESTWHCIERAVESDKHVLIYVNSISAIIIPMSAFASDVEKINFLNEVRKFQ